MDYHAFTIRGEIDSMWGYGMDQLQEQLDKAGGKPLFIDIDSVGGCIATGMAMFAALRRYAEENNVEVTTRSAGFVASIATAIFLAGDRRIVNEFMQPFVHEPQLYWSEATDADSYRKEAEDLDKAKDMLAVFYSKNTSMTKEEALDLMANDTWLTADECLTLGFATEIEELSRNQARLVAKMKNKLTNKNEKTMSKKKKGLSFYTRLANAIKPVRAELTLASVDDQEIVFPDIEADATPTVGDAIVVDDDASFTGEVETNNYIFSVEEGKVTLVLDKNEVDLDEAVETLIEQNEELQNRVNTLAKERDKYIKLYNSIGSKNQPRGGKKKIADGIDGTDAKRARVKEALNKLKNK